MPYPVDGTVVALPKLFQVVYFVEGNVEASPGREVDPFSMYCSFPLKLQRASFGIYIFRVFLEYGF